MPRKEGQGGVLDDLEDLENQDLQDEIEENVGGTPRKVTMNDFLGAEEAFKNLMESEEETFEVKPFRLDRERKFVVTERQSVALSNCIEAFDKLIKYEDAYKNREPLRNLVELRDAMEKIVKEGIDSLTPQEMQVVNSFNDIMRMETPLDTHGKNLIGHMKNVRGPAGFKISTIHSGLDILGVMTGIPASYPGSDAAAYAEGRTNTRLKMIERKSSNNAEEITELVQTAESAGLKKLTDKFKETEIGEKLEQILKVVNDLNNYSHGGQVYLNSGNHLKDVDDFGTFLRQKGKNGKSNYETIAEAIVGKDNQNIEQKKAFDLLLSQLNTVCDLDIGVPDAIEAQEEYDWNKKQKEQADELTIKGMNEVLFGKNKKVRASDYDFLDSVRFFGQAIDTMRKENDIRSGNELHNKLFLATMGLEHIVEKIKSNSSFERLEENGPFSNYYPPVLKLGRTLHEEKNGKKIYDLLVETYEKNGKTKEDLDNTLTQMNEKMGIKIVIPGKEIEGQKVPVKVPQAKPYVNKIKEVQRASNRMTDPVQLKMALASVMALRRMSVDPAHQDHTKIRKAAAQAKAMALMETDAFKDLTKDMTELDLATKIRNPENFDKKFAKRVEQLDEAKYTARLKENGARRQLMSAAKSAAKKMDNTGTGEYWLGIKRGGNSGMYDRAILAMERAAKKPDGATTMQSVLTVKEYLSNKMTPRKSPSGKTRWKSCMEFLHEAMPEEEFKAYCDQINQVRKAKPGSSNYIRPDDFQPQVRKNSMQAEQVKNKEENLAEQEISRSNSF